MRELKFKIWDRQANRWAENDCSLHCCSNWQIDPFTGQLTDFVSALDSDEVTRYNADPAPDYYWKDGKIVNKPRYVLVQYTGLNDKNGVEIYEGDIVKFHPWNSPKKGLENYLCNALKQIKWGLDSGEYPSVGFVAINLQPADLEDGHQINSMDARNMEVVGNIFENPELLEK